MAVLYKTIKLVGTKGSEEVEALFDTGATYSCIRRDLAERLETILPLPEPIRLETAEQGRRVEVRERVILDFWFKGCRFSDEFLVVPSLSDSVIVGAKTMQAWRMKLDLEAEDVVIDPRATRLRLA